MKARDRAAAETAEEGTTEERSSAVPAEEKKKETVFQEVAVKRNGQTEAEEIRAGEIWAEAAEVMTEAVPTGTADMRCCVSRPKKVRKEVPDHRKIQNSSLSAPAGSISEHQFVTMFFQPPAQVAVIRTDGLNGLPEGGGMVHMGQVAEFMYDHIIEYGRRREHQPPVKGEGSFAAAASPSRFLVADGNAFISAAGHGMIIGDPFRNIGAGRIFIPFFQRIPLYIGKIGGGAAVFSGTDFQIVRDDPVAFFFRHPHDFPLACAKGHAENNFTILSDGNGKRFPLAFYNCKRERVFVPVVGNCKSVLHGESFLQCAFWHLHPILS